MAGVTIVDDHLLLAMLLEEDPAGLRRQGDAIFVTGLWYHRLCQALSSSEVVGALSRRVAGRGPEIAARVIGALVELPDEVGLVSLRSLGWPMAVLLADGLRCNLLGLEAIAAAEHLDARICLSPVDVNPPLVRAASDQGIRLDLVEA